MMKPYANPYQSTQVQTASPEKILIMLYDGAIRFLRQAAEGMEQGDYKKKIKFTDKALAIISELSATLDHEVGGEVAANLASLYDFMIREIPRANAKNDPQILQPVLNIMEELREAWVEAAEIVKKEHGAKHSGQSLAAGY